MTFYTRNGGQIERVTRNALQNPSEYQKAIFDWIENGQGHGAVIARAGSGKSTSCVEMLYYMPDDARVLFMAFNKSIATELKNRCPDNVECLTYHGYGNAVLRRGLGKRLLLQEDKMESILRDIIPNSLFARTVGSVKKLVGIAKNNFESDPVKILALAEWAGMSIRNEGQFLENIERWVLPALAEAERQLWNGIIDFDDMCWGPLVLDLEFPRYDFVIVDEVQDTNKVQMEMVARTVENGGRLAAVGDPAQSVYGFRGADCQAMPRMVERFGCKILPLSITYRCPVKVVELAQEIVPDIEARPGAPEGEVLTPSYSEVPELVRDGDMVLSRTTAALVGAFLDTIALGKKAVIRGRDLGKTLSRLAASFEAVSVRDLERQVAQWRQDQVARYMRRGKVEMAMRVVDDSEAVEAFCAGMQTVSAVVSRIERVFSDTVSGVVFSTVHRAKGLEAPRVFILRPDHMPHPMARQEWEIEQEHNLKYVAITRAMDTLFLVQGPYPQSNDRYAQYGVIQPRIDGSVLNEGERPQPPVVLAEAFIDSLRQSGPRTGPESD